MKFGEFMLAMFSTDGKVPSWYRIMAAPAVLAGVFCVIFGAIKFDGGLAGIGAGLVTTVMGFKALQKKNESTEG